VVFLRESTRTEEKNMYVHIGSEYSLSDRFIIGIFDMDTISPKQTDMIHFLAKAEEDGKAEYISEDIPKSVIVTVDRVYFSPISSATLQKRIKEMYSTSEKRPFYGLNTK
jgi:hypothetical protein